MTNNPKIILISKPLMPEVAGLAAAVKSGWRVDDNATAAESLIEYCGRLCYLSFGNRQSPKSNRQYIAHLIKAGHESVLEHASWTFVAYDVTRSFSHQLVRHRIGFSFSQLSQQYVDHRLIDVVDPDIADIEPEIAKEWKELKQRSLQLYDRILKAGDHGSKEGRREAHAVARLVLPNAATTKVAFTANARALRHFLKLRGGIVGDHEMRRFSATLLKILLDEAPNVFQDFELTVDSSGVPIVYHREDLMDGSQPMKR
ncbi:FAD-dependent thymidylate synthase [Enterovirga sp. GCM10030262]|uniref:FAD-dependent thymidylate synthase n=1 Tax=Enterovirga sp. GCM10030262 TaxID=3273391 RepID=UPI00360FBE24